jgi:hypothetical protein
MNIQLFSNHYIKFQLPKENTSNRLKSFILELFGGFNKKEVTGFWKSEYSSRVYVDIMFEYTVCITDENSNENINKLIEALPKFCPNEECIYFEEYKYGKWGAYLIYPSSEGF